jgi:hypothetical protein
MAKADPNLIRIFLRISKVDYFFIHLARVGASGSKLREIPCSGRKGRINSLRARNNSLHCA